jgi:hypothetical protein
MNLKIHLSISLFLEWTSRVTLQLETITLPQNYLPPSDGSYKKPFFGNLSLTEVKLTKSGARHCVTLNT